MVKVPGARRGALSLPTSQGVHLAALRAPVCPGTLSRSKSKALQIGNSLPPPKGPRLLCALTMALTLFILRADSVRHCWCFASPPGSAFALFFFICFSLLVSPLGAPLGARAPRWAPRARGLALARPPLSHRHSHCALADHSLDAARTRTLSTNACSREQARVS